jgi:GTP-binding protein HflX
MKEEKQQQTHKELVPLKAQKTALLVGTYRSSDEKILCQEHLDELERLCDTYGLQVQEKVPCSIKKIDSALFLGKG